MIISYTLDLRFKQFVKKLSVLTKMELNYEVSEQEIFYFLVHIRNRLSLDESINFLSALPVYLKPVYLHHWRPFGGSDTSNEVSLIGVSLQEDIIIHITNSFIKVLRDIHDVEKCNQIHLHLSWVFANNLQEKNLVEAYA